MYYLTIVVCADVAGLIASKKEIDTDFIMDLLNIDKYLDDTKQVDSFEEVLTHYRDFCSIHSSNIEPLMFSLSQSIGSIDDNQCVPYFFPMTEKGLKILQDLTTEKAGAKVLQFKE